MKTDICDYFDDDELDVQETEEEFLIRLSIFRKYLHEFVKTHNCIENKDNILIIGHGDFFCI
jgi:hypothetical protein